MWLKLNTGKCERNMVGFYIFIKDLLLPRWSNSHLRSDLSFSVGVLPVQSVRCIYSPNHLGLVKPVFGKEKTQVFGFQRKHQNQFSSYEGKALSKNWISGVLENHFTHTKCSYSIGNCLFLPPLLLLAVRGFYFTLFQL